MLPETMLSLPGAHGTCRETAEAIMREGFSVTAGGRLGSGAYFWRLDVFGRDLAAAWFVFRRKEGCYPGGYAVRGAIVTAVLRCREDQYLDLDMDEFRDEIAQELLRHSSRKLKGDAVTKFYDFYIRKIEDRAGTKFGVIGGKVTPPPGHQYQVEVLGFPRCYCARSRAFISDLALEEIDR